MRLFVRSRSKSVSQGRGYFWQPWEPEVAARIEADHDLVSDYSRSLLIWTRYKNVRGAHYQMYLNGLDAGEKDEHDRPIKHTLVWETDALPLFPLGRERPIRALAVAYLSDPNGFEAKVRELIVPDVERGFLFRERELLRLAVGQAPKLGGGIPPPDLFESATRTEVAGYLTKYELRNISGQFFIDRPEGLLVAIGERFSRARLQERGRHPLLQLVCDSLRFRSEAE